MESMRVLRVTIAMGLNEQNKSKKSILQSTTTFNFKKIYKIFVERKNLRVSILVFQFRASITGLGKTDGDSNLSILSE